jgi:hypothetical protein
MPKSGYIPAKDRRFVEERAYGICEYCRSQQAFSTQSFSIEHIIPKSKGGTNSLDNLAFSCPGCNSHKYNKQEGIDPVSGDAVSLFHPRNDLWNDHFFWSEDFTEISGKTATGRATLITLQLNREFLKNLRSALFTIGKHPPN